MLRRCFFLNGFISRSKTLDSIHFIFSLLIVMIPQQLRVITHTNMDQSHANIIDFSMRPIKHLLFPPQNHRNLKDVYLRRSVANLVGSTRMGSNPIVGTTNHKPTANSAVHPLEVVLRGQAVEPQAHNNCIATTYPVCVNI